MNYSNAVFATLCIIPAYLIIKRIFGSTIAFCSVLALIFNPSFYQASTYGTPHLIAFFFFLISLYCFILWLDNKKWFRYPALFLSCIFLSMTMLIKAPLALAGGIYLALLYLRKIKEKKIIVLSILSLLLAFILFLATRKQLIGSLNTDTASVGSLINWFKYFFGTLSFGFIMRQIKPPVLGAGVITSLLWIVSLFYYLYRRRIDIILFVMSWSALTYFFWFFVYGNNTRHFMVGVLPVIVMVIMFFHEKTPKITLLLTSALIFGNAIVTAPSPSTYFTSGNLFASNKLHNSRVILYHSKAKEIADIDENKIAVMGYFHNPYVIYEILSSVSSYEAKLLTSVRSSVIKIKTDNKEYMLCYIDKLDPAASIERAITHYDLDSYLIVSATFDLDWLKARGIQTKNLVFLDDYHRSSFKDILSFF
jgi:hypothetical protein